MSKKKNKNKTKDCKHQWASLLAQVGKKTIPSLAKVCLKCGELKIGEKTIRMSRYRLDMGDLPIKNVGGLELAPGKNIKIEETLSADHTWSGITCDGTAGEALAIGDVCYLKSDGKYWKADADAAATMPVVTMATATIAQDASGVFLLDGYIRDDTWTWTVGGVIYAPLTPGNPSQTKPSATGDQVQEIGFALTADILRFNPIQTLVEIS